MGNPLSDESGPSPGGRLFEQTHWSIVLRARDQSEAALETLCRRYRRPLLVWLRGRGCPTDDAEDIVQGLFAALLARRFLLSVDREKGRFRNFLLRSLKNHWLDQQARIRAMRRGGGVVPASLDETDEGGELVRQVSDDDTGPDLAYDRAWASELLENSLSQLKAECARLKHSRLFAELEPSLYGEEQGDRYRAVGDRLGMSEGAVKVAASRLRSRLRAIIQEEIRQTIADPDEWESEVRYLMGLFAR